MVPEKLTADGLERYLRGQLGLILGPGLTLGAGGLREIARDLLAESSDSSGDSDPFLVVDRLIADGVPRADIIQHLRTSVQRLQKHVNARNLSSVRWSAVLSFSVDIAFETEMQAWAEKSPVRPRVATIIDPTMAVPPRSLPVYKMLGVATRDDFVLTTNDYRLRKIAWPQVLRDFSAYVRANPVLCCGFAECEAMLLDLLAFWIGGSHPYPRPFILSETDPLLQSPGFRDLTQGGMRIVTVAAPLESIVNTIQRSAKTGYTPTLPFGAGSGTSLEALRAYSDLAIVVNLQTTTEIQASQSSLLHELLFSPTTPHWDAFVHHLDFRRTASRGLDKQIKEAAIGQAKVVQIIVQGPAAVGKTTVLKRSALALATNGALVLWFRPYYYQDGPSLEFCTFSEALGASRLLKKRAACRFPG